MKEGETINELMDGPIFQLYTPVAKLETIHELLFCATQTDIEQERLDGLSHIIWGITDEIKDLISKAEKIHDKYRGKTPNPKAG